LLIRPETIQLINKLRLGKEYHFDSDIIDPCTVMHGHNGSGKSSVLSTVAMWARHNGWIVLWIPSAEALMTGQILEFGQRDPGLRDNIVRATPLIKGWLAAHQEQLKQLHLKTNFTLPNFQRNANSTLYDLLKFGVDNPPSNNDVIHFYKKEISLVTEYPVLIAIDSINSWSYPSKTFLAELPWGTRTKKMLEPERISIVKDFMDIRNHSLVNGTTLVAISHRERLKKFMYKYYDLIELGKRSAIQIPLLRKKEFDILIQFYCDTGFFLSVPPLGTRTYMYYMSSGCGHEVWNLACGYGGPYTPDTLQDKEGEEEEQRGGANIDEDE